MENRRPTIVPIDQAYTPITRRVLRMGDIRDIETWKKAFPKVDFSDTDEALTGESMTWDKRPLDDRFVNVALHTGWDIDRRRVWIDYHLDVTGNDIQHKVDDSERQWYLLFDGALRVRGKTGKRRVSERAIGTLFYYSTQNEQYGEMVYGSSPEVKLRRLDITIPAEVIDAVDKDNSK